MDSPLGEYIYFYCNIPYSGPRHLIIYDENTFILIVLFLPPGLRSSLLKESVFFFLKSLVRKGLTPGPTNRGEREEQHMRKAAIKSFLKHLVSPVS